MRRIYSFGALCLAILILFLAAAKAPACDFPACHPLQKKHDDLLKQIHDIQQSPGYIQDKDSPHPGAPNPEDLKAVKELWAQVTAVNKALTACILAHGGQPALNSVFEGTATLITSHPKAPGPYTVPLSFGLTFGLGCHSNVDISNFPELVVGDDTATVTLVGGGNGTYDPATGAMWLYAVLNVNPSAPVPKSDLSLNLSTENPGGSRLPIVVLKGTKGYITLTASGVFQGGYLGGSSATVILSGTISPHP